MLIRVIAATVAALVMLSAHAQDEDEGPLSEGTFKGMELRPIGPALMSGRIADVAIHPDFPNTWYVGVGSGGVWRTTNAGTTFRQMYDEEGVP